MLLPVDECRENLRICSLLSVFCYCCAGIDIFVATVTSVDFFFSQQFAPSTILFLLALALCVFFPGKLWISCSAPSALPSVPQGTIKKSEGAALRDHSFRKTHSSLNMRKIKHSSPAHFLACCVFFSSSHPKWCYCCAAGWLPPRSRRRRRRPAQTRRRRKIPIIVNPALPPRLAARSLQQTVPFPDQNSTHDDGHVYRKSTKPRDGHD